MKTLKYICSGLLLLSALSCNENRPAKPAIIIKPEPMVDILTDLYLVDGLLNVPEIRRAFQQKDSVEAYMEIIEGYGFSKEEFDTNLEYYFLSKPKKFEAIYDDVLDRLSRMEDENIQASKPEETLIRNLWNQKTSFRLPDDGISNPVNFAISIPGTGKYTLKFRANIFEDDQSEDLATEVYFWYDDGSEDGVRDYWDIHLYEKSSRTKNITLEKTLADSLYTELRGELLHFSPKSGHWEMHSSLTGISLIYVPDESREDAEPENKLKR
ncbi:MAG: DUF4296 domain-containing protein [Marinilabiliaceae bacterium]|jgi:hypothetical protein|nr:DUF4296 domain-containing protein [Marinilabiliaceae bacterium]